MRLRQAWRLSLLPEVTRLAYAHSRLRAGRKGQNAATFVDENKTVCLEETFGGAGQLDRPGVPADRLHLAGLLPLEVHGGVAQARVSREHLSVARQEIPVQETPKEEAQSSFGSPG